MNERQRQLEADSTTATGGDDGQGGTSGQAGGALEQLAAADAMIDQILSAGAERYLGAIRQHGGQ